MLAETLAEPVDEQAEGVDRQTRLVELGRLLGEVKCRELEQPVAMVRDHVLGRGGGELAGDLDQLLLGCELALARSGLGVLAASSGRSLWRSARRPGPRPVRRSRTNLPVRIQYRPGAARDVRRRVSRGCSCC